MTDAELAKRLDVLRAKGVASYSEHEGISVVFGPLPDAPKAPPAPGEPERPHPADLVANPPELGPAPEEAA